MAFRPASASLSEAAALKLANVSEMFRGSPLLFFGPRRSNAEVASAGVPPFQSDGLLRRPFRLCLVALYRIRDLAPDERHSDVLLLVSVVVVDVVARRRLSRNGAGVPLPRPPWNWASTLSPGWKLMLAGPAPVEPLLLSRGRVRRPRWLYAGAGAALLVPCAVRARPKRSS